MTSRRRPLRFSAMRLVHILNENLLSPLSLLPQLCTKKQRQKLVGMSFLPPTAAFAADDELLWAAKARMSTLAG